MATHTLFTEVLTKTALDGHVNDDLVIKAHAVLHEEEPSMETKWFRPYMRNAEITNENMEELVEVFNRIQKIHSLIEDKKGSKENLHKNAYDKHRADCMEIN